LTRASCADGASNIVSSSSSASASGTPSAAACSEQGVRVAQKMRAGRAFLREYSCKRLKLAQRLGRHGVLLTCHFD
jgi:hypothetical protein